MSKSNPVEAITAWMDAGSEEPNISFVCPHCHSMTQQAMGWLNYLAIPNGGIGGGRSTKERGFIFAGCLVCSRETIFFGDQVIFPLYVDAPLPSPDMPDEIRADFEEARLIVGQSPRGAAALLRLAIQKFCPLIGATPGDINAMIGELVAKGKITPIIQRALDSVRVIGNEAVHPGTIDLRDDPGMALALFRLINLIVEKVITEPRHVDEVFASLPPGKLAGINRRDQDPGRG